MGEYLLDWRGRGESGWCKDNFIWRDGNIYIMDNHRAAAWCWAQHVNEIAGLRLLHVDKHTDSVDANTQAISELFPRRFECTLNEYLAKQYDLPHVGIISAATWENYIALFTRLYPEIISKHYICIRDNACNGIIADMHPFYYTPCELVRELNYFMSEQPRWIVNIDLDYFWHVSEGLSFQLFSEQYIRRVFQEILTGIVSGKVLVTTVALSPECCGGWDNAEHLLNIVCDELGLDLILPD